VEQAKEMAEEEAVPVLMSATITMPTTASDHKGTNVAPHSTMEREDQLGVMALKKLNNKELS